MAKKKKKDKNILPTILTIILILAAGYFGYVYRGHLLYKPSASEDNILATVNGEPVTSSEVEKAFTPQLKQVGMTEDDVLNQVITIKVLLQRASELGITATEEDIDEQVQALTEKIGGKEELAKSLSDIGYTMEDIREQTKTNIIINKLISEEIGTETQISKSEINNFYAKNIHLFEAGPGEIRASHILVQDREEAEEVLEKLDNGEKFEDLAEEYSMDIASAGKGGDLGFFNESVMSKEFSDAAFALKVGEVSGIVETEFGYHIIKRTPSKVNEDQAIETITDILSDEKRRRYIETYIDKLRMNADIKKGDEIETETEQDTEHETNEPPKILFTETEDSCKEDTTLRLFVTQGCDECRVSKQAFISAASNVGLPANIWELDTGDNLLTEEKESSIPRSEVEIFRRYSPKSMVPLYVLGCRYKKIGNSFDDAEMEEKEIKSTIEKLIK